MKQQFFRVSQTAELLGYKERTIRAWIASGKLEAIRFGVSVRIPSEAIEHF